MKETNMEHFRGEIEAAGYIFGKVNRMIVKCKDIDCRDCDFKGKCVPRRIKWLMSEYKPEPVLTAKEKGFVECIKYGYIARDEGGVMEWYAEKPLKQYDCWLYSKSQTTVSLNRKMFPFITWEDEEPWAVTDLRKLKALEYNPEDVAFPKGGEADDL